MLCFLGRSWLCSCDFLVKEKSEDPIQEPHFSYLFFVSYFLAESSCRLLRLGLHSGSLTVLLVPAHESKLIQTLCVLQLISQHRNGPLNPEEKNQ